MRFVGRYSSGQRGQTVNLLASAYRGSNPLLPTTSPFLPEGSKRGPGDPTDRRIGTAGPSGRLSNLSANDLWRTSEAPNPLLPTIFFLFALLFFCAVPLIQPSADAAPIPKEEYEIYSSVLSQLSSEGKIGAKLFVISETVKPSLYTRMNREGWSMLFQNQLGISPEPALIDDFIRKNGESFFFENRFGGIPTAIFKIPVVLGQEAEINWGEFNEKYPEANGLIEFSRIGLNKDKTKALLYVGVSLGREVSSYLLVLAKGQGGWAIAHQLIRSLTPRMQ